MTVIATTAFIEAADTALVLARENIEETQIEAVESEVVAVAVAAAVVEIEIEITTTTAASADTAAVAEGVIEVAVEVRLRIEEDAAEEGTTTTMTMTIAVDVAARLDLPKIVEEMAGEEIDLARVRRLAGSFIERQNCKISS